ncbi:ATP-binding cassette protein, putative [Hondaea fermentalgiana]|uniref:ATP-binding cassette protein, putative n=1 Tax=Hondaea fermentalgiana TaxID=2315210 RepID=A0A2R5GI23_9STRA|nr:ATP-binding cassette protein, putative [Hondaea fermentalgiana]|eukprot:GBG30245.1 ATP-binding cassette protein, putative [Hondaea fermentalgiana]
MASFTIDAARVGELLARELDGKLDEDIVEYLSGMVAECEEPGEDGSGLEELLAPFLESYGAAEDEDEAAALAKRLSGLMLEEKIVAFQEEKDGGAIAAKLKLPVQMNGDASGGNGGGEDDDTWGLKTVTNKPNTNTVVDSISDALNSKKSLERMQKRAEKDRKKEEARIAREEAEMQRSMEAEYDMPASQGKMTVNLRNKSEDVLIENVNISVGGGKSLLEDATLQIVSGRRYGLIGRNGVGKSTLLRHISKRQLEGFPSYLRVVHVEQEAVANATPVIEVLLMADEERQALLTKEKELMAKLESDSLSTEEATEVNGRLRKVYDELAAIGADSAEAEARSILGGLGFSEKMQEAPTNSLSGGWRMRVALATALFLNPDILLLDEPTNHLDILSVIWLEEYLSTYPKTLILVSHDRKFTNNVITDVIHLEHQKLNYYKGDIDIYEQTRENQRLQQQREYESQQAKRAHMQKFVDKFRYNAKRASLAQSRIKALNKMTLVAEVLDDPEFQFSFPAPQGDLNKAIEVKDVSFGYPGKVDEEGKQELLFEHVDFSVFTSSRIVILGENGCGKSTLIKNMLGELDPVSGYVERNPKARFAFFTQHHVDQLDTKKSALDYMLSTFPGTKPDEMRPHLAQYGIPADLANQRIGTMSGGQKSRVAFAKITFTRPHVIVCDEPSNHLDLETVAALCMAINTFEGGIVLVSHDQYLIEMVAEEIWVVKDRRLINFKGNLDDYKRWVKVMADAARQQ